MAIFHCQMKSMSRASGHCAVAAIAYRTGDSLTNERDGVTYDYSRKGGVVHAEIVLPDGVEAEWARDRSALWNAAERAEKRKDARVAREFEVSLPHELDSAQRQRLAVEFAQRLADRYGVAVDIGIHEPSIGKNGKGDERNHHAHLLMTTRQVGKNGLGEKSDIERENKWLLAQGLPAAQVQLKEVRRMWEEIVNAHLARAELGERIDHRSHRDRGLDIVPTQHQGVRATHMARRGIEIGQVRLDPADAKQNAALIAVEPEQVLKLLTDRKSVFTRNDIARTLHRAVADEDFQAALARVTACEELVEIRGATLVGSRVIEEARFTTRGMLETEVGMRAAAARLGERDRAENASATPIDDRTNEQIRTDVLGLAKFEHLSEEQRKAVEHLTGREGVACAVGVAGSGKSTMLDAAREVWEKNGYRVQGAALSGKAAEGLERSSAIPSRTLRSWEYQWGAGQMALDSRDVFVIDEAGMVSSRQMAGFVAAVEKAGAKLVLVGDAKQLQPIEAGAAFRAIAETVGHVALTKVRRQREGWQREASEDFGAGRTEKALLAYSDRGAVRLEKDEALAQAAVVRDVLADMHANATSSRIVLAHRRMDVRALNDGIRQGLKAQGLLQDEVVFRTEAAGEKGERGFAAGDRIVFLENSRDLGVKNGTLGTVRSVQPGMLEVNLDEGERLLVVKSQDYQAIDHGYATTIHKSQGATVDRAFVLASKTMDQHLSYVAMTRHRERVTLYADQQSFRDEAALARGLSRNGAKETTLDYLDASVDARAWETVAFGARRGIEVAFERVREVLKAAIPEVVREAVRDGVREGIQRGLQHLTGVVEKVAPAKVELEDRAIEKFANALKADLEVRHGSVEKAARYLVERDKAAIDQGRVAVLRSILGGRLERTFSVPESDWSSKHPPPAPAAIELTKEAVEDAREALDRLMPKASTQLIRGLERDGQRYKALGIAPEAEQIKALREVIAHERKPEHERDAPEGLLRPRRPLRILDIDAGQIRPFDFLREVGRSLDERIGPDVARVADRGVDQRGGASTPNMPGPNSPATDSPVARADEGQGKGSMQEASVQQGSAQKAAQDPERKPTRSRTLQGLARALKASGGKLPEVPVPDFLKPAPTQPDPASPNRSVEATPPPMAARPGALPRESENLLLASYARAIAAEIALASRDTDAYRREQMLMLPKSASASRRAAVAKLEGHMPGTGELLERAMQRTAGLAHALSKIDDRPHRVVVLRRVIASEREFEALKKKLAQKQAHEAQARRERRGPEKDRGQERDQEQDREQSRGRGMSR